MEFSLPRTKTEMYDTLKSIYNHYRLNSVNYNLDRQLPLELINMEIEELSCEQLLEKAEILVKPSIIREKQERKDKLKENIEKLKTKKEKLDEDYVTIIKTIQDNFEKIKDSIEKEARKKGVTYTSLTTDKMYQAENDRAKQIAKSQEEKATKLADINAEISTIQNEIDLLDTFYSDLLNKDISKKFEELKDEQEKLKREQLKYNNNVHSSLVRHHNACLNTGATLELKYLEIRSKGFSKEALVDMGYYADCIDCICGYYDSLNNDVTAFNDIKQETGLMVYMDDFYGDLLLIYKVRAGT